VNRLNYDEHGVLLGEFNEDDLILVVLSDYTYYVSNFDANNHYEDNILRIEKFDPEKVWSVVLYDADNEGYPYIKRFVMEPNKRKQSFVGENPNSKVVLLTDQPYPRIRVTFGGADAHREPMEIEIEEFIAVKGFKAKGKRITTWKIANIEQLEPTRQPEPEEPESEDDTPDDEAEDLSGANETEELEEVNEEPEEALDLEEVKELAEAEKAKETAQAEIAEEAKETKEAEQAPVEEPQEPAKPKKRAKAAKDKKPSDSRPSRKSRASRESSQSKESSSAAPPPTYPADEERSPQFKYDPKTGELSLFSDEDM
jgi:hypothetical protein